MMNSSLLILIFLHICCIVLLTFHFGVCTAIVCIPSERETLLKLKHNLTDPSNRLSSWNATSISNCCHWDGVVCSKVTSHVVELHLNTSPPNPIDYTFNDEANDKAYTSFGYSFDDKEAYDKAYEAYKRTLFGGEINPCLVDLKHLNYLDLSGNDFGSIPIPPFLVTMTSLTHLNLSYAAFNGNIPSQIGNLSNLLYLDLKYVVNGAINLQPYDESLFAENVDWLSSLSKLQYLDLSHNYLLGRGMSIPTFIGTMTSLSHLDLSYAGFMGEIPYQIGNLSNLLYLDLSYAANGTIPSQIGNLFNLVYLHCRSDSLIPENLRCLSNLSKLEYLDLEGAKLSKSFDWLHTLQALPSLKHLHLSDCVLPDHYNEPSLLNFSSLLTLHLSYINYSLGISFVSNWIFGLKKLISLQLRGNKFQGPIPDGIQNLTLLQNLDLSENSFSSSIPDWLYSLHHLKFLNLRYSKLHGNLSDALGNLTCLVGLDLSHNKLGGTIPTTLGTLTSLIQLDLSNDKLEGTIPTALGNLTSLVRLDLSYNQLKGSIPTTLGNLTSLVRLYLSYNQLKGIIPTSLGNLNFLVELDLSNNEHEGTIPTSLGNLCNLKNTYLQGFKLNQQVDDILETLTLCISHGLTLAVSGSQLSGNLPNLFGKLSSLRYLNLSKNQFSGNPFESLRSLSSLSYLDIGDNHFQGVVKEDDLANLRSLTYFYASGNNFTLKVGPNWLPTFQLTCLYMSSWHLGPNFPQWIQSQNNFQSLEMSNTGILDSIPTWFWAGFSQASYVNLSHNHIHGELRSTLKNALSIYIIDLSSNHLHGKLPDVSDHVFWLDLSSNSFSESMNDFLCNKQFKQFELQLLNLASNKLSGKIPDCWIKWPYLNDVNLQNNHFVGNLPASMGSLASLQSLNVRNNSLSGIFPTILKNSQLVSLDLGENNHSGTIPTWIGEMLLNVKDLRLRSNNFSGHIPHEVCDMIFLQDLDLAHNSLSGNIPNCFNHFDAMLLKNKSKDLFIYSNASSWAGYNKISMQMWIKGRALEYNSILGLVTNIDLSGNNLSGGIPREITYLDGLIYLNLSKNQLTGQIPSSIGNMRSLESIDISRNQLSGEIPPTITNLSFLNNLDLSYNHLKGQIPTGTQIQSFDVSNFVGNYLCGPPLPINCSSNHQIPHTDSVRADNDGNGVNWFFVSMAIGFIVGFWVVVAPLFIYRSWRYAYFRFLDDMWYKLQSCW